MAVLSAGVAMLGWIVIKTSTVDAVVRANPVLAAQVAPRDPKVARAMTTRQFQRASVKAPTAPPALVESGKALSRSAPLSEEPFVFSGLAALKRGDVQRAGRLFEEAVRRDPRSRFARLLLLDNRLRTNQVDGAISEIAVISRLVPESNVLMVPELAKLALVPEARVPLKNVLDSNPGLKLAVLDRLVEIDAPLADVLWLAGDDLGADGTNPAPLWQVRLLETLVDDGRLSQAHAIWRRIVGLSGESDATVYDPGFQARRGPPPFDWRLLSDATGVAEPASPNGLNVTFYGRQNAVLAQQLLRLVPGRYRIAMLASVDGRDAQPSLSWTIVCRKGGRELTSLPLIESNGRERPYSTTFEVPSDCVGQWLTLVGHSSEFPKTQTALIQRFSVSREDGQ